MKLRLTGEWKKFKNLLHPEEFRKRLEKEVRRAMVWNARVMLKDIRMRIQGKEFAPNAPLTVILKGSSTPLVDAGSLWQAFTYELIDSFTAFVGLLRTARNKQGKPIINLGYILHEGAVIKVTERMRRYFYALAREKPGVKPLRPDTKAISIPPRPFIKRTMEDEEIKKKVIENWCIAVKNALYDEREPLKQ